MSVFDGGNLQQRDQLAGGRQPVLDQAVVGQLGQFLNTNSGVAQYLHHSPRPEPAVFFETEIAARSTLRIFGPDSAGGFCLHLRPAQGRPGGGEQFTWPGAFGGCEQLGGAGAFGRHQETSAGSTGSRSRVRASMRDFRCDRSFLWEASLALTGQRTAHGPHRAGSSSAHSAMSR